MMNDKDYEISELLQKLGETRPTARILTLLRDGKERKSIDIEREASLRQPEVSISTSELMDFGWVIARREPAKGKGRPTYIYRLDVSFYGIIKQYEMSQASKIVDWQSDIAKLREMVRA